jgi:hypothetical protein
MSDINITADLSGLNYSLSQLVTVLNADAKDLLLVEAGQMAWRIAQGIGPASAAKGNRGVERDVRSHLSAKPRREFKAGKQGQGDMQWLYAGPEFLVGIERKNSRVGATAAEATRLYYQDKTAAPRNAWTKIGGRGKQNVLKLDRIRVKLGVFKEVAKAIKANVGQAKASFAFTTAKTTAKKIPLWISSHFSKIEGRKAIFSLAGIHHPTAPAIVFGSRARGVISNPKMAEAISSGVRQSAKIVDKKVQNLLNGYAYDFKTGGVFRPKTSTFDRN